MPKKHEEEDVVNVNDEDFDIDEDEDIEVVDGDEHDDDENEDGESGERFDQSAFIRQCVADATAEQKAYVDKVMKSVNKRLDDHDHRIKNLEKMVHNLSDAPAPVMAKAQSRKLKQDHDEQTGLDRILDATFGTAGRALHAIVDATAYIAESVIDLATLGRARRT